MEQNAAVRDDGEGERNSERVPLSEEVIHNESKVSLLVGSYQKRKKKEKEW